MTRDDIDVNEDTARALGLSRLDRQTVANRLAELAALRPPTQNEAQEFLVAVLLTALSYIPSRGTAWSWGEFHNGGIQPLFDIDRAKDWQRLAICAVDLGLDARPPRTRPGEELSPREALARNLGDATEGLLHEVRKRLEAAGVSPYGQPTVPPSA